MLNINPTSRNPLSPAASASTGKLRLLNFQVLVMLAAILVIL